ncbi:hypothetical protein HY989_05635 [Candidatus Micrarchaeota archaeon]|nr:hypothetical protein [Candidatus Micrarchaeota archaeon]
MAEIFESLIDWERHHIALAAGIIGMFMIMMNSIALGFVFIIFGLVYVAYKNDADMDKMEYKDKKRGESW